ncbi:Peptidoglycan-binding domain-containing protein, expansin [Nannocystis exedens]|uniref:Peptidoglycan-binding domain-containing protein, expansin n=1 Tax=Nannocystis exedens TaxID=54 RepID=A0A1I2B9Y8_9BACT|nr:expansin EXLX1 family cellulose-binding protein [Nannocystis exedens]PCC68109.1 Expansin-YoaJ precursor [Nannocystis exedens]SFE52797.1 Peptidoglycan-binding domain-containing protein, expansin [Nannocystis exedens]
MRGRRFEWAAIFLCTACPGDSGDTEASTGAASTASTDEATAAGPTGSPGSEGTAGPSTGEDASGEAPTSAGPTSADPTSSETSDATSGATSGETTVGETSGETSSGPGTSETTGGGQVCEGEDHAGKATYYAADGSGNCSFDANPGDDMVAAMNTPDYMASAACGACVQIDGPDGQIVVRIVDRCPECESGHIDLDEDAFPMIADKNLGVVPITWRYVSCTLDGPIVYHFKEGSNQWWTAVQIRNHRNAIAKLEFKNGDDAWQEVPRLDYNYFVAEQGMGPGPYAFRVTDVHGHALEDARIPFVEAGDSPGAGQFPACSP